MTPANICSGFRKCGVFPYNPDAIDCSISTDNPAGELGINGRSNDNEENDMGDDRGEGSGNEQGDQQLDDQDWRTFSDDQIRLFTERYEEGYDVYDKEYLQWLTINHPESIPVSQTPETSFADLFSFVSPCDPLTVSDYSSDLTTSHTSSSGPSTSAAHILEDNLSAVAPGIVSSTHTLGSDCSAHALNLGHSSHTLDFYPSTHIPRSDPSTHTPVTDPSAHTTGSDPSVHTPERTSQPFPLF